MQRTAKLAPPLKLKILTGRELLLFENFKFFGKICYTQCLYRKFFPEANDRAFPKFWFFISNFIGLSIWGYLQNLK